MKITSGRVLDKLHSEEPCLGAVFTSYSFDPAFFEDHVLRAVLRLSSDPVEQATRYHGEARRALQQTPVVAIVDAGERRPGRRLPYDLLEISEIVFHPKAVLLLYQERARLLVGSGNLTFSGYGGNTELFLSLDLAYNSPADVALLRAFDAHLSRIGDMARQRGTQLNLFREELTRRVGSEKADIDSPEIILLDSTTSPIIEQLKSLLPDSAVIEYIGMLAPFYERDDDGEFDLTSVFGSLAQRTAKSAILDVGVALDNAQVHPSQNAIKLEAGLNRLWAWTYDEDGTRKIKHMVPTSIGPNSLSYIDQTGQGRRWPIDEAISAVEERMLWMQPLPVAFAPRRALEAASENFGEVRLWLHPAWRLLEGRPVHRQLHAKLLIIGFRDGRTRNTLVLMGSANMSRRALLQKAGHGGNIELCLAFCINDCLSLIDLVPELVFAPPSTFELQEREFPELERNYALAIDQAIHDPVKRTLIVTWSMQASDIPAWKLTYNGKELASSNMSPSAAIVVQDFVLNPSSAEVIIHINGREYSAPILVTDLVALPATPEGSGLGLNELLMLLGRRIGAERAVQIAQAQVLESIDNSELTTFFGEGFSPTDVFRAWWSVAEDLQNPSLSVPAFRFHLEGALGAGTAWGGMLDAIKLKQLQPQEVWFYGAELLRTLDEIELPPGLDSGAKKEVLAAFCERVQADLSGITLDDGARQWVQRIKAFYKVAHA